MKNIEKLFEYNTKENGVNVSLDRTVLNIRVIAEDDTFFTGLQIEQIIQIINAAHKKYGKLKFSINFFLGRVRFIDKLTYVFFECICYYLIEKCGHPVQVYMSVDIDIGTDGVVSSPLKLLNATKVENIRKYPSKFKFDIYGFHYRRVVNGVDKENTNYLGDLDKEISDFLKYFSIDDECRNEVGTVIAELVGNASEHARTECLIDIDVAPDYKRYDENGENDGNYYYGINIAVINFSDKLLGDDIRTNVIEAKNRNNNIRYNKVLEAYEYHSAEFGNNYTEEDFCNITTFQTKISGREDKYDTGGTGLTVLIRSLEKKSEKHKCYVISGKRCVNFFEQLLEYDKEGWIGFNDKNDYFKDTPEEDVVNDSLIYMPGTAYNFNFVMKGERIDNE